MIDLAENINNGEDIFSKEFKSISRSEFITQEWQTFIRTLDPSKVTVEQMKEIDKQLQFSSEGNPAIKSDWYQLAVKTGYEGAKPHMREYLIKVGRRWYIEGIYQELKDSKKDGDLTWAKEVFAEAQKNYHYVSKTTIQEVLYSE